MASLIEEYNKQAPLRQVRGIFEAWDASQDCGITAADFPQDNVKKVIAFLQEQGLPIDWISLTGRRSVQLEWHPDPYFFSLEVFRKGVSAFSCKSYQHAKLKKTTCLNSLRWFLRQLKIVLSRTNYDWR